MPEAVRTCDLHGYFAGGRCPACGDSGRPVVSRERRLRVSKYLSGALRHFPDDAGIELDDAGWATFDEVALAVAETYEWADDETIAAVVATDPKGRFERDPGLGGEQSSGEQTSGERTSGERPSGERSPRVRAAYGHSVDVRLAAGNHSVPATLYHGTALRNRESILAEGLRPMGRQRVHLSGTVEAARDVGRRHTDVPIMFAIDASGLQAAGHEVIKRGPDVYTTDRVPPAYLAEE